jgi:HEAT repeat protein
MEAEKIQKLLFRYNAGQAGADEIRQLETLIADGLVRLEDIEGFERLENQVMAMESPEPSASLNDRFYQMLHDEKKASAPRWIAKFDWNILMPRFAFAALTLLVGLTVGYLLRSPAQKEQQIEALGQEISQLKEMMMLSMLEKESATDRLKAVNLTQGMDQASIKVTSALLQTLNNDENVNVRLAALDALKPFTIDSQIREALIRSISNQKSPLVQVALAELMAALQEKAAVGELQKLLKDSETPSDIKKKIQESIQVI